MNKTIWALAFVVLACGTAFAIENASVDAGDQSKYVFDNTGVNWTTEGGNVTDMNLTTNASTEKWAGVYGNVTGTLILSEFAAPAYMYEWTYNVASGGEVCASVAAAPDWTNFAAAVMTAVDTAWGFDSADADSVNSTATGDLTLNISGVAATSNATTIQGSSDFLAGIFQASTTSNDKADFVICTAINAAGTNYLGDNVNFELMLPTNDAAGTFEEYYFFMELI